MSESGAAAAPSSGRSDRTGLKMLALVAVFVVIVGVVAVVVLTRSDKAEAKEISLQSNTEPGPDPYTPSAATPPPTSTSTTTQLSVPPPSGNALRSYVGGQPGLYGGTRNQRSCDAGLMLDYLDQHPAKKAAWAAVHGIALSDVRTFVSRLTSVLLRTDTLVTNHGYSNGRATTLSSVLQAGTAVLVDSYGVPRVKCFCGNPLTAPARFAYPLRYSGTRWSNFNTQTVVVIQQNTTVINNFTLIDPYTGQAFSRPASTDGSKDAEVPGPQSPTTTSTSSTTTSSTSTTTTPTTSSSTSSSTTPESTAPPSDPSVGSWQLTARYQISDGDRTGTESWNASVTVGAGGGASGSGSGSAQVSGGCYNTASQTRVADFQATISFRVNVSGSSNGSGRLQLQVSSNATLDSLQYSTNAPETQDCRQQAESTYQSYIDNTLGSLTIEASPGATASIGASNVRGTVTINR